MNNDKADFTQGSILKKLIAFMIPVLGALILQAAYGAADLLVVGRFGFRPFRCLHRQPGLKPRHLRRNPVRYGYHGFDRPLSR